MNHTPGPWKANKLKVSYDEMGFSYKVFPAYQDPWFFICKIREADESEANAKLIAAAPEMYELLTRISYQTQDAPTFQEIENLLNKINNV